MGLLHAVYLGYLCRNQIATLTKAKCLLSILCSCLTWVIVTLTQEYAGALAGQTSM